MWQLLLNYKKYMRKWVCKGDRDCNLISEMPNRFPLYGKANLHNGR